MNKKSNFFISGANILFGFIMFSLASCSSDSSVSPGNTSTQIQKKWLINNDKSASAIGKFSSIEFNNSAQAMVAFGLNQQSPDSVRSYFYKMTDSKTVDVKNFGKLKIGSISDSTLQFDFSPVSGGTQSLSGKKSNFSVGNASNTSLLCRTWKFEKMVLPSGQTILFDTILGMVTFTNSGTYFVNLDDESRMSWWKWYPSDPGKKICYSHQSETFDCELGTNVPTITKLTNTELVVDENGGVTYLSPYTLSGRVATGGVLSPEIKKLLMQKYFFGR